VVVGADRAVDLRGAGTVFITPERARSLGLEIVPTDVVFRTPEPLTDRQLGRLEGLYAAMLNEQTEIDGVSSATYPDFYRPGDDPEPRSMEAAAAAAALLLALFVVAATLGLSAVESRDERDVLAVVGAAPATLRRAGARKAVLLTLLGGAMAVPVGYLPVLLLTRMDDGGGLPAIFPWRTVAVVMVGVPIIAGLATSLASGIGQRLRPVTMSTLRAE
jgi:ABC-type antimicrobial peptide transport system permease subunit